MTWRRAVRNLPTKHDNKTQTLAWGRENGGRAFVSHLSRGAGRVWGLREEGLKIRKPTKKKTHLRGAPKTPTGAMLREEEQIYGPATSVVRWKKRGEAATRWWGGDGGSRQGKRSRVKNGGVREEIKRKGFEWPLRAPMAQCGVTGAVQRAKCGKNLEFRGERVLFQGSRNLPPKGGKSRRA